MTNEQIEIARLRAELVETRARELGATREVERLRIENTKRVDEVRHWRRLYASELENHDVTKHELAGSRDRIATLIEHESDPRPCTDCTEGHATLCTSCAGKAPA